jgi:zinc protease
VRADVVAFHAAHYTAQRATVAIVGDLSRAQAESVAEQLTVGLPSGPAMAGVALSELPAGGEQRIAHPAVQAHLLVGIAGTQARRSGFLSFGLSATILSAAVALFHA